MCWKRKMGHLMSSLYIYIVARIASQLTLIRLEILCLLKSRNPIVHNKEANQFLKDKRKERKHPLPKFQKPVLIAALKHSTSLSESDLASSVDSSDASDSISIHYVDDMHSSEGTVVDEIESAQEINMMEKEKDKCEVEKMPSSVSAETVSSCNGNDKEDGMSDGCNEEESESEIEKDSTSSQEEAVNVMHENKVKRASRVPKNLSKKLSPESSTSRGKSDQQGPNMLHFKSTSRRSHKGNLRDLDLKSKNMKVHAVFSSESEGSEDKANEDEETGDAQETSSNNDKLKTEQKIQEMEERIGKLEEELRDIAALEISLYSVVPEHGSSAHKVHTPARRLSRFYIHACKHWTQDKRARIAKNTVSGLVLIAKSCGSDVPRLTYWWSNTVVLREIITQAFGAHHKQLQGKPTESNGGGKVVDGKPQLNCKKNGSRKQLKALGFMQFEDDWQEISTFIAALEKVESWMFSRVVESVWWQSLTPHMQELPIEEMCSVRSAQILGPALGDHQQGSFSINIWRSAFQEAFQRLCPVRAGGHECGCLPVLARMVMEQCVGRLDVAMFNAILRESAHEMPTDPVSDPIVDSKVLPIPDGNLSFGSGAQLKNSVGNWSRYLANLFGMPGGDVAREEDNVDGGGESDRRGRDGGSKYFHLLNALSDLLMLPKDMLVEKSIRKEVCPTLGSPIIKRILCNFTPDEFCPDPVPGSVLEALNSEGIFERRLSDDGLINSFPYVAAPVVYCPPAAGDVTEKIRDAGRSPQLGRNVSLVQTKGSTSDEELDELNFPLTSIIDKTTSPRVNVEFARHTGSEYHCGSSVRYDLLREVWLE